jgi:hypothetical protein
MRFKNYVLNVLISFLILIQRTDIQKTNSKIINRFSAITKNRFNLILLFIRAFNYKKIFVSYESDIIPESNLLDSLILKEFSNKDLNILDIGCGISGYHRKYAKVTERRVNLYLMDNSELNLKALSYGHGNPNRYYNSLFLAKKFLQNINNNKVVINTIEIKKEFPDKLPNHLDLIVSFISWGFHYSIKEYWSVIMQKMRLNSSMIVVDVRKNSQSYDFLNEQSNISIEIINSAHNYDRILIRKISA